MKTYIEHINIAVADIQETITFFQTAFPHFVIRGGAKNENEKWEWLHLGTNDTYIAINQAEENSLGKRKLYESAGFNHVGFVVTNAKQLAKRLEKAGYKSSYPTEYHQFRTRVYFFDKEGNDYEFVEYHSEKDEERNQYDGVK